MRDATLVDLHSHILPRFDDGARDDTEALQMLRIAVADGVQTIVATPHVTPTTSPEDILSAVSRLNQLASEHEIPIHVAPGSEVPVAPDLADRYQAGKLLTLNQTPYILLELPLIGDWPPYLRQVVFDLQLAGAIPILAHVERYPAVQHEPSILLDLIDAGVILQVNASSVVGRSGSDAARHVAETLLTGHMAHVIASDAHRARGRTPALSTAMDRARSIAGSSYTDEMIRATKLILDGKPFSLPSPKAPTRESWIERVRQRLRRN